MKKEVILTIKGMIEDQAGKDTIDFITQGTLYEKEDYYCIIYKESEMIGIKNCTTMLKIQKERVTLTRYGETNSQMIFEQRKKHVSGYDTPFGTLTIGVRTYKMDVDLSLEGGKIEIQYDLDINNMYHGSNMLSVKVAKEGDKIGLAETVSSESSCFLDA